MFSLVDDEVSIIISWSDLHPQKNNGPQLGVSLFLKDRFSRLIFCFYVAFKLHVCL